MKFLNLILSIFFCLPLQAQTDFSQENATNLLQHLSVEIGPRPMGSPAEQSALQFAVDKFKEYGCDTAYIMKMERFSRGNTNSGIAIGIKRGLTNRIILIGGHIDSSAPEIPGTNDDGSGSAVVIEAAHMFGKRIMKSTLVFCCFGGEEVGLIGSKHFAANFPETDSISFMLQVDMANGLGILDIDPDAHQSYSAPKWLVRAALEEYSKLGYKNLRYPTHFFSLNHSFPSGPGSDHEPFLQMGVPSIAFISDVSDPVHTPRDNFENFDPAGLKRTGDVVVKLVERFDAGIPTRELEQYWLYLIGSFPIFIPYWGLWLFVILTMILTAGAFVSVRKRREPPNAPDRIRWPGVKMFLFSFIIVACGWLSSDLIGLIKGVRHPWLISIDWYFWLSAIAMFIGLWFILRLSTKIRLSQCPYVFFKRAIIILMVLLVVFGLAGLKLTVEPCAALLFISLAILVRKPWIKFLLVVLSPWWMMRLIFSEWFEIFSHEIAKLNTVAPSKWLLVNIGIMVFFSIYIIPFLFAFTAVIKDAPTLKLWIPKLKSVRMLIISTVAFAGFAGYLLSMPVHNNLWYRDVYIDEECDMNKHSMKVDVGSSEYLNGLTLRYNGNDTAITTRKTIFEIAPKEGFDTNLVMISRQEQKHKFGDTIHYDINLILSAKCRPYTVSISYSMGDKALRAFDTPYNFRTVKEEKKIEWYSFSDSVLNVPVRFSVIGNDSVKENIEVTFDKLVYPIEVKGRMLYVIPRTKFVENYVYRK